MTKFSNPPPSTRQLAQQGDLRAIATLINQSFQQHQVRAEVQAAASRLTVRLTGQSVPNPQLAAAVQKGLLSLKLTQFSELVVMGFWADEGAAMWIKQLSLSPTVAATQIRSDRPAPTTIHVPPTATTAAEVAEIRSPAAMRQTRTAAATTSNSTPNAQSSSQHALLTKWAGIGLCLLGIVVGITAYRNRSSWQFVIGRPAPHSNVCSADFLAEGGALDEVRLSCLENDPEITALWLERTVDNPNQLDVEGHTLLQTALKLRQPDLVRQALEHGVDPNVGNQRNSPLALAVSQEYFNLVQLLINRGADITYTWTVSDKSENALMLALQLDDLAIAERLLDAGMPYVGRGSINLTGMADTDDFDLLDTLIAQGLNINEGDIYVAPPLEQAIKQDHVALARFLLERGATVDDQRLHRILKANQADVIALLSERGAQIDVAQLAPGEAAQTSPVEVARNSPVQAEQGSQVETEQSSQGEAEQDARVRSDRLTAAVRQDSLSQVTAALDGGADVNQVDSGGYTPLTKAVSAGASDPLFQLLISRGANVNQVDGRNFTPLSLAAQSSYDSASRMMELLLSQGAQINQLDGNGFNPLMRAVLNSKYDAIDLLIAKGANVNQTSAEGKSALAIAMTKSPQLVEHLLAKGASFDPNDPLSVIYAIDQGDRPLLNTLINQGANLNQIGATDSDVYVSGRTPLTAAIANKNSAVAILLLDNGAQLNFPDPRETPLTAAIDREQWEIVDQLLTRGANYTQADPDGQTPLNQAIRQNNTQLVKRLLDLGADPNQPGDNDYTPLMATLQPIGQPPKDAQIIQALLDSGAELRKQEMFRAIRDDHVATVRLFLDHGWGINARVYGNHTPLSAAVGYSTPEMAQLMLDRGADTDWRGHHYFTLMDLAKERDSQEMIRFLRRKGIR
ncbi:MAG: ankyrin repeat domain-containing protein [Cyanobacteria bacterium P01_D01_bin.115]